jgi:hypothetical protein
MYTISADKSRLDVAMIHRFLSMRTIREHPSLQGLRRWHLLIDMEIAVKKPYG